MFFYVNLLQTKKKVVQSVKFSANTPLYGRNPTYSMAETVPVETRLRKNNKYSVCGVDRT